MANSEQHRYQTRYASWEWKKLELISEHSDLASCNCHIEAMLEGVPAACTSLLRARLFNTMTLTLPHQQLYQSIMHRPRIEAYCYLVSIIQFYLLRYCYNVVAS